MKFFSSRTCSTVRLFVLIFVLGFGYLLPHSTAQPLPNGQPTSARPVTVYLVLEGEPVTMTTKNTHSSLTLTSMTLNTKAHTAQLQAQHTTVQGQLQTMNAQVTGKFIRLAN